MDLNFSAEQQELIEAVRRFCREQITPERLTAWERLPAGMDNDCWHAVSRLGWLGLGLPPEAGGSGLGLVDVAAVLAECARGLVPTIVATAIRGAWALAQLEPRAAELPALARGDTRLSLACEEEYATEPDAFTTRVVETAAGPCLVGEKWYVQHAPHADFFIVAARDGDGLSLVLADKNTTTVSPLRTFVSGETQGIVRFDRTPFVRRLTPPAAGPEALIRVRRHQLALGLAEMVGGMDKVLELTVAYVKEREQFGRKIGVFQAVQHQVADMATAYTASRHLAWQAITRIAADSDEAIDLPAASAFVGQAFKRLTLTAHHLHGGAGYVVEHPLHCHSERAQSLCVRYTPEGAALADLAATLLD